MTEMADAEAPFLFDKYEEFFKKVEDASFTFLPPKEQDVAIDRENVLEHFQKLQFNYLELETKRDFLETLAQGVVRQTVDGTEIKEKSEVATAVNQELQESLSVAAKELHEVYKKFNEHQEQLTEGISGMREEIKSISKPSDEEVSLRMLEDIQSELDKIGAQKENLSSQKQMHENKKKEATAARDEQRAALAEIENQVKTLRSTVAIKEAELNDERESKGHLVEMATWYKNMTYVIERLGGVSIAAVRADALELTLKVGPVSGPSAVIDVLAKYHPGTVILADVTIGEDSVVASALIEDIAAHAVKKNSLVFFIREAKKRIECFLKRKQEEAALRAYQRFSVASSTEDSTTVFVTFLSGVIANIWVSPDYGSLHGNMPPRVRSIALVSGEDYPRSDALMELLDQVATPDMTLTTLVLHIDALLNDQDSEEKEPIAMETA